MRTTKFFVLLLGLSLYFQHSLAQNFSHYNIDLLGKLNDSKWACLSSLWGYTAPDGTEYAILGACNGVSIVSLANPNVPQELHFISGAHTIWREVKTFSHYAYIVNEAGDGLRIIDLEGLPTNITYKDTIIAGIKTSHTISEADGYLYLNLSNLAAGFSILDLHPSPWHPKLITHYPSSSYIHDCYVRNDTVFAAEMGAGALSIIDVRDKANPKMVGMNTYLNGFTHNTGLNDAGTVCFTTDEYARAYLRAWDIRNPANISRLDEVRSGQSEGKAVPHNVHIQNDYAVTSYYEDGVVIFDVSRPHNMAQVAYFDTYPQPTTNTMKGCWGVYPHFSSGNIIASDMENGLFVLKPTYKRAYFIEGIVTDANTQAALSGVKITYNNTENSSLVSGLYGVADAFPTTATLTFSKTGYYTQTINTAFSTDSIVVLNVQLVPKPITYSITSYVVAKLKGTPIANVQMEWKSADNVYQLKTNSLGLVAHNIQPDTYEVRIGAWGYQTTVQQVVVPTSASAFTFELYRGYYDDFYFDFGWEVSASANKGVWEWCEPVATYIPQNQAIANPNEDAADDIGSRCYVTENEGVNVTEGDVDNGFVGLTSPTLDLSSYQHPVIRYQWWFFNGIENGNVPPNDYLRIVLKNSEKSVTIFEHNVSSNGWKTDSIEVRNYFENLSNLQLYLVAKDVSPEHIVEAGLDKFQVTEKILPPSHLPPTDSLYFQCSPNPMENQLTLNYQLSEEKTYLFEIIDLQGRVIRSYRLLPQNQSFSLEWKGASGLYLGRLMENGKYLKTIKIQKI